MQSRKVQTAVCGFELVGLGKSCSLSDKAVLRSKGEIYGTMCIELPSEDTDHRG